MPGAKCPLRFAFGAAFVGPVVDQHASHHQRTDRQQANLKFAHGRIICATGAPKRGSGGEFLPDPQRFFDVHRDHP